MESRTLAFATFILILQVVSGVYSSFSDESTLNRKHGMNIYEVARKKTQSFNNLDDVYENQLPSPPTQKDVPMDTRFEDEIINDATRGTTKDSSHIDRNVLSGAGHLETNAIVKNPNVLSKKAQSSNSEINNDSNVKIKKEQAPVTTKSYNFPELDKAVEKAVNNLPSSDESPLVPLIKIFNKRVNEQSDNENGNPEELASKKFLQKHILLKLANKVQRDKEDKAQSENQNTHDLQAQEFQTEDDASQAQNQSQSGEESMPCGCTDGCGEETAQNETDPEETSDQGNQSGGRDELTEGRKIKAHVIIMLRKPKLEDASDMPERLQSPFYPSRDESEQPFRSRKDPQLADMFLRSSSYKSALPSSNPSSPFDENEDFLQVSRERIITGMTTGGFGDNDDEDENGTKNNPFSFSRLVSNRGAEENSQEMNRASFSSLVPNDHDLNILNLKINRQSIPKEFILLKHLHEIMKEKAAANAFRERQEKQVAKFNPFSPLGDSSNAPKLSISRLVLMRPINKPSRPELPPLYFPDENSGLKIKHGNYLASPQFRELKRESLDSDGDLGLHIQPLNNVQEIKQNRIFTPQLTTSTPQDIPWFIKNILSNLSRPAGESSFQPIPTQITPLEKPAEEKNPVVLRAFLAPFAI